MNVDARQLVSLSVSRCIVRPLITSDAAGLCCVFFFVSCLYHFTGCCCCALRRSHSLYILSANQRRAGPVTRPLPPSTAFTGNPVQKMAPPTGESLPEVDERLLFFIRTKHRASAFEDDDEDAVISCRSENFDLTMALDEKQRFIIWSPRMYKTNRKEIHASAWLSSRLMSQRWTEHG
ncbi:hypothetical protein F2P81_012462 [Scophthalmus maximus]|uniref:Uncharacterized protein n=1 Tax=Scophthalmus maximus TaxID=52904 RepID=A0A6A4SUH8_SCOMX|nr:hypothetical protein F2P81_012462 [Scophthalmus maximus]